MLARVLLCSSKGQNEVAERLKGIGFRVSRLNPIRIPHNQRMLDVIGVVALFVAAAFLPGHMTIGHALAIAPVVAVNHGVAAAAAVLPKQFWTGADIRYAGERPVLGYMISGLCAITIALPVSFAFHLIRQGLSDGTPALEFTGECKWLLLSTVLAVALAFECDDCAGRDQEPAWLTWVESAALPPSWRLPGSWWCAGCRRAGSRLTRVMPGRRSGPLPCSAPPSARCSAPPPAAPAALVAAE